MVFVCQTVQLSPWDLSILGGLYLSDGIILLVALEHVGWSLLVRPYNFTPGT